MNYEIFLVDVDDTVLDFHRASAEALKTACAVCGVTWEERFEKAFRAFNGSLWASLERKEITRDYLMNNRFTLFFKELNMPTVSGEEFNKVFLDYLANTPIFFDGAKEFLKTLGKHGRVYFVTNGTAWIQKSRFDKCGLWEYAKQTFVSDTIGYDKPSPLYTQYVIERIEGFQKEKAVWIGDSLSSDMQAAAEAGIDSVWFTKHGELPKTGVKPTFIANSYEEVLKVLGIT